jgi:hypothetical protein
MDAICLQILPEPWKCSRWLRWYDLL